MDNWILPGKTLIMGLSSYCGARCLMCPFEQYNNNNRSMSFDLFKKCVDEGSKHGLEYIDTCLMGDSLLDPGLDEKIAYTKTNYPWIKFYASSQGMSATPNKVCGKVDTLHLSIYGTSKEVYEKVHRGGVNYEVAMKNIEEILSYPKDKRPYLIFTFLLLPENEFQLEEWIRKWESLVDEVIVWKPHNWAGLYNTGCPIDYDKARSCQRPAGGPLTVWVNGDVTVCCFSWDKSMKIGDANKQSLEDIYFSKRRKEIIKIHSMNSFHNCGLACENCDQILDRNDALVYTNKGRITGQAIVSGDYVVRFVNDNGGA